MSPSITSPKILYGTAWKKEKTAELVEQAVLAGFRGIDTACQPKHYEEPGVGKALRSLESQGVSRKEIFIQTKFTPLNGQDPKRIPYDPKATLKVQVNQSFQTSQKNIGSDFIDSLVLHSPLAKMEQTIEVWRAMESLCKEKVVGQIGISNCYHLDTLKFLYKNAEIKPSVLQNRFYQETNYDKHLRKFCIENKITYQSFWTLSANDHILNDTRFKSIARECKKTEAQILFRYLTLIGIVPLTGTRSKTHMDEDLEIFNFNLSDKQMQTIDSFFR